MKGMRVAVAVALVATSVVAADAQDQATPPANPAIRAAQELETVRMAAQVPIQVRITISRLQGDRVVSSRPYTVSVNANGRGAQLRMGAEVPVPSTTSPILDGKPVTGLVEIRQVQYRDVGTNIDVEAATVDRSQFEVTVNVQDTSVYLATDAIDGILKTGDLPVFRSFQMRNSAILRDGQTTQFSAASDRVSGELMRVEVTLNVQK